MGSVTYIDIKPYCVIWVNISGLTAGNNRCVQFLP
jgi:hypothetical protein